MSFTDNAERRIIDCVRDYERSPRFPSRPGIAPRPSYPIFIGRTTTAVTARSGDVPGFGMVQRRVFDGTNFAKSVGNPVKVFNDSQSTNTWAANTVVKYTIVDGYYFFLTSDCSAG